MIDMGSYTYGDTKEAIIRLGHTVDDMYYHFSDRYEDDFFSERFELQLKRHHYDAVLSINFFPLIATGCHNMCIPYISWSYDSPLEEKLSKYFEFDTNRIFLFDRKEVEDYNRKGFDNVWHLPLAVNLDRLDKLAFSEECSEKYKADVSFVGRIHKSELRALLVPADEYIKGYVEGLFQTQIRVYGYNFLEEAISDSVIDSLNEAYSKLGQEAVKLNKRGLAYAINSQITYFERKILLEELAQEHKVHFYTTGEYVLDDSVIVHGPVKYYTDMNAVFRNSKLNLCPTLRSIASGIPLRALDIMGAGGVLFSN